MKSVSEKLQRMGEELERTTDIESRKIKLITYSNSIITEYSGERRKSLLKMIGAAAVPIGGLVGLIALGGALGSTFENKDLGTLAKYAFCYLPGSVALGFLTLPFGSMAEWYLDEAIECSGVIREYKELLRKP